MVWQSWSEFFAMGGRAFFVWGSFGVSVLLIMAELCWLRAARRARLRRLLALQQLEGDAASPRTEPLVRDDGLDDARKA